MAIYKIIKLNVGDPWPLYGIYDDWENRESLAETMELYCNSPGAKYENSPEQFKVDREMTWLRGRVVMEDDGPKAVIVLEEGPVMNEFGEESP